MPHDASRVSRSLSGPQKRPKALTAKYLSRSNMAGWLGQETGQSTNSILDRH